MLNRLFQSDFAAAFKKYRLKSEIETLTEFGDLLAEEGFIYENSLFTRWQNGERIPKDRKLLLKIIEIFAKRGGLKDENEANNFLESASQRDLNEDETLQVNEYFHVKTQTLPKQIEIFVGRDQIIKDVTWMLLNKKRAVLYGPPGVGKTAIGIRIGHLLQDKFPDGVLWLRADIKKPEDILDEILLFLHIEIKSFISIEKKLQQLSNLSQRRHFLVILDNISLSQSSIVILKKIIGLDIPFLLTSIRPIFDELLITKVKLDSFSKEEFIDVCNRTLGKPFVEQNKQSLMEIGRLLGYLPISCVIILKQILSNPLDIKRYIEDIKKYSLRLDKMSYDDKNLLSSFEISFKSLDSLSQKILVSSSMFEGTDFTHQALAFINNCSISLVKKIIDTLLIYSLVENSIKSRYRLHPAFRQFLRTKIDMRTNLMKMIEYYIHTIKKIKKSGENYFNQEIENIAGIMQMCVELREYTRLINIWEHIKVYLWYLGKWNTILLFKCSIQKAYKYVGDQNGLINFWGEDISRIYFYTNNRKQLAKYLLLAKEKARLSGNAVLVGLMEQKYGFVYLDNNKLSEAKDRLEKSIKLMKKNGPKKDLIKSYIYLGKTFIKIGDLNKAAEYLKIGLKKSIYYKISEDIGLSHIFLGQLYIKKNNYYSAIKHLKVGLKIEKDIKRKVVMAMGYEGLGDAYKNLTKFGLGTFYYKNAKKLYFSLNMKRELDLISKKINNVD